MPEEGAQIDQELLNQLRQKQESQKPKGGSDAPNLGGPGSDESDARLGFNEDFQSFLSLLTTQLKNQNPMKPMDSKKFTDQLVKFSGVEQQISTNEKLDKLIAQTEGDESGGGSDAIGYLDKIVQYAGNSIEKQAGDTPLGYKLSSDASNVRLELKDDQGRVVRTFNPQETSKGRHEVTWDGTNRQGQEAPAGTYTLNVLAQGKDGQAIEASAEAVGRVRGADLTGEQPNFEVNNTTLTREDFLRVRLPG